MANFFAGDFLRFSSKISNIAFFFAKKSNMVNLFANIESPCGGNSHLLCNKEDSQSAACKRHSVCK